MKYIFLNHFAFENIDNSKTEKDIIEVFNNIAYLLRDIRVLDYELIFDNKLSRWNFKSKAIHYYLRLLDRDIFNLLVVKIQKPTPFCSDTYDGYFEDGDIVLGNCIVDNTEIEILENFLACALFLDSSIVTPKTICSLNCFLNEIIIIKCDAKKRKLKNYFLKNRDFILDQLIKEIKKNTENWDDWKMNVLPLFENIEISDNCFNEINNYSFSSGITKNILRFIENINKFVKGKSVSNLNYVRCCSNTNTESDTRLRKYKQQLTIYNCNKNKETANWHTWIKKDFRLYFVLDEENNKICFVKFTKKIT